MVKLACAFCEGFQPYLATVARTKCRASIQRKNSDRIGTPVARACRNDNMKSLLKTLCQTMGLDPATGEPVNSGQLHQQLKATKLKNESWGFVSCTRMAPIMMDFIAAKKVSKPDMMKIESW